MNGIDPQQLMALQRMMQRGQQEDTGLLTFKAGRSFLDEATRMVNSDKKRGKIRLRKDPQGLLHFQWLNRINNNVDLDLIVMPHESKWERVADCTDGRVYILRMVMANTKHFFWVQEPEDEEKDKERDEKMKKILLGMQPDGASNASAAGAAAAGAGGAADMFGMGGLGAAGPGGQLSQEQLLSMFSGGAGNNNASRPGALGGAASGATSGSDAALAQGFLTNLLGQGGAGGQVGGQQPFQDQFMQAMQQVLGGSSQQEQIRQLREQLENEPDLNDVLNPEDILPVFEDQKVMDELSQHLPEEMRDIDSIREQLSSPHFRAAVARLEAVINGPQMATILQSLQLESNGRIGVRAFLEAMRNRYGTQEAAPDQNANDGGGLNDDGGDANEDVDMPDA